MTVVPTGPEGHVFGRGDYGAEYASDIVEIVERMNCSKGCRWAIEDDPTCQILANIYDLRPVPEIDPRPDGPVCNAREPVCEVTA